MTPSLETILFLSSRLGALAGDTLGSEPYFFVRPRLERFELLERLERVQAVYPTVAVIPRLRSLSGTHFS
jgi:hypothetical protein